MPRVALFGGAATECKVKEELLSLFGLEGRRAVVTGGATGIGEGIAKVLADADAEVVICDIDVSGAEDVAKQIRESGGQASVCRMDVTDLESVEEGFAALAAQGAIDILVNNAGSYRDTAGSILDRDADAWRRSIEINLESVYLCSRSAAQQMVSTDRGGVIVSVSSVDATLPCLGVGYDVAKAGVNMFTRSLAVDLAPHKIRVNAVAPGYIAVRTLERMALGELAPLWPEGGTQTGLQNPLMAQRSSEIPLNRPGRPTDIGNAVLFLSSDASSYVTGQVLHVDGGWTLI